LIVPKVEAKTPQPPSTGPSTSTEIVYETPKQGYDVDDVTVGAQTKEEEGTIASPLWRFLDTQYGVRQDGEQLMIGDSLGFTDPDDNITIQ